MDSLKWAVEISWAAWMVAVAASVYMGVCIPSAAYLIAAGVILAMLTIIMSR